MRPPLRLWQMDLHSILRKVFELNMATNLVSLSIALYARQDMCFGSIHDKLAAPRLLTARTNFPSLPGARLFFFCLPPLDSLCPFAASATPVLQPFCTGCVREPEAIFKAMPTGTWQV